MGDRAINWIHTQHAVAPEKPFLMYFAPGNGQALGANPLTPEKRGELERLRRDFALRMQ